MVMMGGVGLIGCIFNQCQLHTQSLRNQATLAWQSEESLVMNDWWQLTAPPTTIHKSQKLGWNNQLSLNILYIRYITTITNQKYFQLKKKNI